MVIVLAFDAAELLLIDFLHELLTAHRATAFCANLSLFIASLRCFVTIVKFFNPVSFTLVAIISAIVIVPTTFNICEVICFCFVIHNSIFYLPNHTQARFYRISLIRVALCVYSRYYPFQYFLQICYGHFP